jgi:transcriptional regulator with XRE-family HTH domain
MKLNLQKIKQFRKQQGLNQKIIANVLGISIGAYSKRESGQTPISLEELERLAEYYKRDMSDFFDFNTSIVPDLPLSEKADVKKIQIGSLSFSDKSGSLSTPWFPNYKGMGLHMVPLTRPGLKMRLFHSPQG